MTLRSGGCLLLAVLMLGACSQNSPREGGTQWSHGKVTRDGYYVVRSGDTLYRIATRFHLNYKTLARINGLRSPYVIRPGDKLAVKGNALKSPPAARKPRPSSSSRPGSTAAGTVNRESWRWPTSGRVVRTYSTAGKVHKGIDIGGTISQPVVAAKSGKVVYAGHGLKAYGLLVIIKHDDHYLSAYAYNRRAFVQEGDSVKKGQKIAQMGSKEGGQARLHFEIRRDGRPVNPITMLPRR